VKKKLGLETIRIGVIAALYCALILLLAPLSFGPIQFRPSNLMMALIFHPTLGLSAAIGISIGGILSNFFGPFGLPDVLIGSVLCGWPAITFLYFSGRWAYRRKQDQPWLALAFFIECTYVAFIIGYVLLHLAFDLPAFSVVTVWVGEVVTKPIGISLLWPVIRKVFPYSYD